MSEMPLMKCGHTAQGTHQNEHDGLGKNHPACLICDCCTIEENKPDLSGRTAQCSYFGRNKPRRRYANDECNYGCRGKATCMCGSMPSSFELAFFKYKGEGSYSANNMCTLCEYSLIAHLPKWEYKLAMLRDWFKNKNINDEEIRTEHMPDKNAIENYVNNRIKYLLEDNKRPWLCGKDKGKVVTKIHKIHIEYIKGPFSSGKNHDFVPHGAYEYDEFYCGCRGWD